MERIDYDAGESCRIEQSLLKVELPGAILLRHQPALQTVREPRDHALQVRELLVQVAAQPFELLWFAQVLGRNGLVVFCDKAAIVRPARLVLAMSARAPRLGRSLGITHFGIVGHLRGERLGRLSRGIGCVLARNVGLIDPSLRVLGVGTLPVFPGFFLATVLFSLLAFLLVGLGTAVLAHVERIEQIVNDISETRLVFDEPLETIEIASGAILDQRAP
jgi:hypothetical protein